MKTERPDNEFARESLVHRETFFFCLSYECCSRYSREESREFPVVSYAAYGNGDFESDASKSQITTVRAGTTSPFFWPEWGDVGHVILNGLVGQHHNFITKTTVIKMYCQKIMAFGPMSGLVNTVNA